MLRLSPPHFCRVMSPARRPRCSRRIASASASRTLVEDRREDVAEVTVALRSPSSRSVRLGCVAVETALHALAQQRRPARGAVVGAVGGVGLHPPAELGVDGTTTSRPARRACHPRRGTVTAWSSRPSRRSWCSLVGVGVEAAQRHREHPGRHPGLDAGGGEVELLGQLGAVCAGVRCASARGPRRLSTVPRSLTDVARPVGAQRPRRRSRPARPSAASAVPRRTSRSSAGHRAGRVAAAAAFAGQQRRQHGLEGQRAPRSPPGVEPAAEPAGAAGATGRRVPDVHRAEVAAVRPRVAHAVHDRQPLLVPEPLEARHRRVEPERVVQPSTSPAP